ncbi:App1 family protein [Olivibacter sp. XZL3]|uniref:App1 family protein n=1 Tax=Olivibacter sp. XZL3 TaxID=1735116 RepID=UPI00106552AC|nr:phosphatase domain-containing protein [Olivibacter sp. XZL3]
MGRSVEIKIYSGYGHSKNLVVYGHVLQRKPRAPNDFRESGWRHTWSLMRLFFVRPVGGVRLRLHFYNQVIETVAQSDGFFKFKWATDRHLEAGLHSVKIELIATDKLQGCASGKVYVPQSTQYVFVSDIDDTVLVSHSATGWRRLRELLVKNAYRREVFADHVVWYNLLSRSGAPSQQLNPFFYVSSSEWNLYDYLQRVFDHNGLPQGSFLLSHFKRWLDFFKAGKTGHEDKYRRISRLLRVFPKQKFVLIGDNSQRDPEIYTALANNYPDRVAAVYIRNIKNKKAATTLQLFKSFKDKGIRTCLFNTNREAIEHSVSIGLVSHGSVQELTGF